MQAAPLCSEQFSISAGNTRERLADSKQLNGLQSRIAWRGLTITLSLTAAPRPSCRVNNSTASVCKEVSGLEKEQLLSPASAARTMKWEEMLP